DLHEPQAVPDQAVAAKARELTAGSKTELERISAIAHFVQNLQYISIDIGIGKGNGYKPHAASQVLAKAYGDCKDKANLMRSMLRAININAYPVVIYSGDPNRVREEWASPNQFNHCIIAVKVSDETVGPTVMTVEKLGRLLIFDATDSNTKVGDLPDHEQGSLALLVAGDQGQLLRMPTLPPESSTFNRHADVVMTSEGSITATVHERANGQAAADSRRLFRGLSSAQYLKVIEGWVSNGATGAKISRVEPKDNTEGGRFDLDVDFTANSYAQLMQNRLLVFRPVIVSRQESLYLTDAVRQHPVVLDSRNFSETVRVKIPAGFEVDELPDPLKLDTSFGSYKTTYAVKDGELTFTRALAQRAGTIPVAEYQAVRRFFERIRAAEQSPVVLSRK
ncbi:MAG TPA: transglutaminase domain-containing protein, partial [Pyrinomonadaceae bacterium]|nr:transglutaminase domain-containing protein [Pyrinomonadaceae bacterium]